MESGFGNLAADTVARFGRALFPHFCVGCGSEGTVLCEGCRMKMSAPLGGIFCCPGCGVVTPFGGNCGARRCRDAALDGLAAMSSYREPGFRALLHLYKYEGVEEAGEALGGVFAHFLAQKREAMLAFADGAEIVPVPMHFFREARRGFNQAEAFARVCARTLCKPVAHGMLRRSFRWSSQARIASDADRRLNVRGSVTAAPRARISGRYLLIDDVVTTGATLDACAAALKTAGARRVYAVTLLKG